MFMTGKYENVAVSVFILFFTFMNTLFEQKVLISIHLFKIYNVL